MVSMPPSRKGAKSNVNPMPVVSDAVGTAWSPLRAISKRNFRPELGQLNPTLSELQELRQRLEGRFGSILSAFTKFNLSKAQFISNVEWNHVLNTVGYANVDSQRLFRALSSSGNISKNTLLALPSSSSDQEDTKKKPAQRALQLHRSARKRSVSLSFHDDLRIQTASLGKQLFAALRELSPKRAQCVKTNPRTITFSVRPHPGPSDVLSRRTAVRATQLTPPRSKPCSATTSPVRAQYRRIGADVNDNSFDIFNEPWILPLEARPAPPRTRAKSRSQSPEPWCSDIGFPISLERKGAKPTIPTSHRRFPPLVKTGTSSLPAWLKQNAHPSLCSTAPPRKGSPQLQSPKPHSPSHSAPASPQWSVQSYPGAHGTRRRIFSSTRGGALVLHTSACLSNVTPHDAEGVSVDILSMPPQLPRALPSLGPPSSSTSLHFVHHHTNIIVSGSPSPSNRNQVAGQLEEVIEPLDSRLTSTPILELVETQHSVRSNITENSDEHVAVLQDMLFAQPTSPLEDRRVVLSPDDNRKEFEERPSSPKHQKWRFAPCLVAQPGKPSDQLNYSTPRLANCISPFETPPVSPKATRRFDGSTMEYLTDQAFSPVETSFTFTQLGMEERPNSPDASRKYALSLVQQPGIRSDRLTDHTPRVAGGISPFATSTKEYLADQAFSPVETSLRLTQLGMEERPNSPDALRKYAPSFVQQPGIRSDRLNDHTPRLAGGISPFATSTMEYLADQAFSPVETSLRLTQLGMEERPNSPDALRKYALSLVEQPGIRSDRLNDYTPRLAGGISPFATSTMEYLSDQAFSPVETSLRLTQLGMEERPNSPDESRKYAPSLIEQPGIRSDRLNDHSPRLAGGISLFETLPISPKVTCRFGSSTMEYLADQAFSPVETSLRLTQLGMEERPNSPDLSRKCALSLIEQPGIRSDRLNDHAPRLAGGISPFETPPISPKATRWFGASTMEYLADEAFLSAETGVWFTQHRMEERPKSSDVSREVKRSELLHLEEESNRILWQQQSISKNDYDAVPKTDAVSLQEEITSKLVGAITSSHSPQGLSPAKDVPEQRPIADAEPESAYQVAQSGAFARKRKDLSAVARAQFGMTGESSFAVIEDPNGAAVCELLGATVAENPKHFALAAHRHTALLPDTSLNIHASGEQLQHSPRSTYDSSSSILVSSRSRAIQSRSSTRRVSFEEVPEPSTPERSEGRPAAPTTSLSSSTSTGSPKRRVPFDRFLAAWVAAEEAGVPTNQVLRHVSKKKKDIRRSGERKDMRPTDVTASTRASLGSEFEDEMGCSLPDVEASRQTLPSCDAYDPEPNVVWPGFEEKMGALREEEKKYVQSAVGTPSVLACIGSEFDDEMGCLRGDVEAGRHTHPLCDAYDPEPNVSWHVVEGEKGRLRDEGDKCMQPATVATSMRAWLGSEFGDEVGCSPADVEADGPMLTLYGTFDAAKNDAPSITQEVDVSPSASSAAINRDTNHESDVAYERDAFGGELGKSERRRGNEFSGQQAEWLEPCSVNTRKDSPRIEGRPSSFREAINNVGLCAFVFGSNGSAVQSTNENISIDGRRVLGHQAPLALDHEDAFPIAPLPTQLAVSRNTNLLSTGINRIPHVEVATSPFTSAAESCFASVSQVNFNQSETAKQFTIPSALPSAGKEPSTPNTVVGSRDTRFTPSAVEYPACTTRPAHEFIAYASPALETLASVAQLRPSVLSSQPLTQEGSDCFLPVTKDPVCVPPLLGIGSSTYTQSALNSTIFAPSQAEALEFASSAAQAAVNIPAGTETSVFQLPTVAAAESQVSQSPAFVARSTFSKEQSTSFENRARSLSLGVTACFSGSDSAMVADGPSDAVLEANQTIAKEGLSDIVLEPLLPPPRSPIVSFQEVGLETLSAHLSTRGDLLQSAHILPVSSPGRVLDALTKIEPSIHLTRDSHSCLDSPTRLQLGIASQKETVMFPPHLDSKPLQNASELGPSTPAFVEVTSPTTQSVVQYIASRASLAAPSVQPPLSPREPSSAPPISPPEVLGHTFAEPFLQATPTHSSTPLLSVPSDTPVPIGAAPQHSTTPLRAVSTESLMRATSPSSIILEAPPVHQSRSAIAPARVRPASPKPLTTRSRSPDPSIVLSHPLSTMIHAADFDACPRLPSAQAVPGTMREQPLNEADVQLNVAHRFSSRDHPGSPPHSELLSMRTSIEQYSLIPDFKDWPSTARIAAWSAAAASSEEDATLLCRVRAAPHSVSVLSPPVLYEGVNPPTSQTNIPHVQVVATPASTSKPGKDMPKPLNHGILVKEAFVARSPVARPSASQAVKVGAEPLSSSSLTRQRLPEKVSSAVESDARHVSALASRTAERAASSTPPPRPPCPSPFVAPSQPSCAEILTSTFSSTFGKADSLMSQCDARGRTRRGRTLFRSQDTGSSPRIFAPTLGPIDLRPSVNSPSPPRGVADMVVEDKGAPAGLLQTTSTRKLDCQPLSPLPEPIGHQQWAKRRKNNILANAVISAPRLDKPGGIPQKVSNDTVINSSTTTSKDCEAEVDVERTTQRRRYAIKPPSLSNTLPARDKSASPPSASVALSVAHLFSVSGAQYSPTNAKKASTLGRCQLPESSGVITTPGRVIPFSPIGFNDSLQPQKKQTSAPSQTDHHNASHVKSRKNQATEEVLCSNSRGSAVPPKQVLGRHPKVHQFVLERQKYHANKELLDTLVAPLIGAM